mmetsp:Transcript_27707/g.81414  ORF Transcript_27707/g.81414 Transcript_27707/m.81414 type:complete len:121 (+) Transcript_27707:535-897(+)
MAAEVISGAAARTLLSPGYTFVSLPINHSRKVRQGVLNQAFLNLLDWDDDFGLTQSRDWEAFALKMEDTIDPDTRGVEWVHPMLLMAKANAEDNPAYNQAMNGPKADGYNTAMEVELSAL